jgi:hypothetical protein
LKDLTQQLGPILGARTLAVVQRLGTVVSLSDELERIAKAPRARRRLLQQQAQQVLDAWTAFRKRVETSDPAIAETLWASGEGFQLGALEKALSPLRDLASPLLSGRPTGARRALILDDLMFALNAAGIELRKTDGGIVEQAAIVVLRCLGDDVADPGRDVAKAISRFNDDKTPSQNS